MDTERLQDLLMIRGLYKTKIKDDSRNISAFTSTPINIKRLAVEKQLVEFLLSVHYFDNTGVAEQ